MGASEWHYRTPYTGDLTAALTVLQHAVFHAGDYYQPESESPDGAPPASIEDLLANESVRQSGTHSILDVGEIISTGDEDRFGAVKTISAVEALTNFGTTRPTAEDFEHACANGGIFDDCPRWSGRCTVLYENGKPTQAAFWGISGD